MTSEKQNSEKSWLHGPLGVGVVTTVLAGVFAIVVAFLQRAPSQRNAATNQTEPRTAVPAAANREPVNRLTVESILSSLDSTPQLRQSDAVAALFVGRRLESLGVVDYLDDFSGDKKSGGVPGYIMHVLVRGRARRHVAFFDRTWREALSAVRKGDTVRVAGTITGVWIYGGDVYTKSSQLIPR